MEFHSCIRSFVRLLGPASQKHSLHPNDVYTIYLLVDFQCVVLLFGIAFMSFCLVLFLFWFLNLVAFDFLLFLCCDFDNTVPINLILTLWFVEFRPQLTGTLLCFVLEFSAEYSSSFLIDIYLFVSAIRSKEVLLTFGPKKDK